MLSCRYTVITFLLCLGYRVTQRGQMHVEHLRYFAAKVSGLQHDNVDLAKHFSSKVHALCKMILRDCCIEMESSAEGVERAASSTDLVGYMRLDMYRRIPEEVAKGCTQICSSSADEECILQTFLTIVPGLIQVIKEIFVDEETSQVQNGLRGLSDETLEHFMSNVRGAEKDCRVLKCNCEVCKILEKLCLQNCGKQSTAEIEKWGKSLAILSVLDFLKPFFHRCPGDMRLHKRLELFSGYIREILLDPVDFADDVFLRDFSNAAQNLIHFSKSDPSKLVRFELTDSTLTCYSENIVHDIHQKTFSQRFRIRKEPDAELQLHAVARVYTDGEIQKMGAFQSVIMLSESSLERFDKCMGRFRSVAMVKLEDKDSDKLRVILCSTQKEKLSEVLQVLTGELSEDSVDLSKSQVTQCYLTMRTVPGKRETVVSLRLIYKQESEAVELDSQDFVAFADSSAEGACIPEMQLVGKISLLLCKLCLDQSDPPFSLVPL